MFVPALRSIFALLLADIADRYRYATRQIYKSIQHEGDGHIRCNVVHETDPPITECAQ